jgi:hypothetical protein
MKKVAEPTRRPIYRIATRQERSRKKPHPQDAPCLDKPDPIETVRNIS